MVVPEDIQKGWYRHFKGGLYQVVDTVIESESLTTMVLYRPKDSDYLWVRPYQMFFSEVEREGITQKRFTYIGESLPE
nr:DUF1653 domain-containing protein [uncultured Sphaerochaeta sp.]